MKTVAVVHTGPSTVLPIKRQFDDLLPDVRVVNIVDDSLLVDVIEAGQVTDAVSERLLTYMEVGERMGAVAILNACSSVGEAAAAARTRLSIPVVKVDETMAETAVRTGPRIGVVATVRTTLAPTVRLIRAKAAEAGRAVEITEALAEGGYEALIGGRTDEHDRLVRETITSLIGRVDVVVLAQVSMARLIESLGELPVPVLSSPRSGVEAVRAMLATPA